MQDGQENFLVQECGLSLSLSQVEVEAPPLVVESSLIPPCRPAALHLAYLAAHVLLDADDDDDNDDQKEEHDDDHRILQLHCNRIQTPVPLAVVEMMRVP